MKSRFVGRSGLRVSEMCFGLGGNVNQTKWANQGAVVSGDLIESNFVQLLDHYTKKGGNFIDLINATPFGVGPEPLVGKWLKDKNRDDFVLATKCGFKVGAGPNDVGLSRKNILRCIDNSLKHLQTDYIDLYYVHVWDNGTPIEETLSTYTELVKSGRVRYIAASNYAAWHLQKAMDASKYLHLEPFIALQQQYNLIERSPEYDIIPVCQNEKVSLFPWSCLASGWLTGKYKRGTTAFPEGSRLAFEASHGINYNSLDKKDNERTWKILDTLDAIVEKTGKTHTQVALNWIKDQPCVAAPVLGVRTMEQLEDSLGALGWEMDGADRAALNEASRLPNIMPYARIETLNPSDRKRLW